MVYVPAGVWALVPMVKDDEQVLPLLVGVQDVGEKLALAWKGKPLAERETL